MEPHFSVNDKKMFYKYLDNATGYFEYGSGGSTYQASIRKNIKYLYSVESDKHWHKRVKDNLDTSVSRDTTLIYNEMDTRPKNWGYPGKGASQKQLKKYSSRIRKIGLDNQKKIDLVLIDGRFRIACCLKAYDVINDDCKIVFDDFLNRDYKIVLQYYNIIEQTDDNRMVILQKKKDMDIPKSLILEYEKKPM